MLSIPKFGSKAEFIVVTDASKVGIAGILLLEDFEGHLRPCAYRTRKLKDADTNHNAYDRAALAMVEVDTIVLRIYLLGCKCFLVVTDRATRVHLLI